MAGSSPYFSTVARCTEPALKRSFSSRLSTRSSWSSSTAPPFRVTVSTPTPVGRFRAASVISVAEGGAKCQWPLLEWQGDNGDGQLQSRAAGPAAAAARADARAGGRDLGPARAAGGRGRRGLGQERDHGGPAGLAGRQRDGPPGPGAGTDLHQEGGGRVRRPGAVPAG